MGDIDKLLEIRDLKEERKRLLMAFTSTDTEMKVNQVRRKRISKKLFELTLNPIYINF
jgi:hypothetical protein